MQSQDTKNIIIVGGATIIGGIINYLVHPIAVRILSTQEFGEFASLLSIVNIVGFIMGAGSIITLKLIAQHHNKSDFMYYLKHKLQGVLLGVGAAMWIIISLCSPRIAHSLHINNPWGIVIIGASMITSIYGIILGAILQSGGRFTSLSVNGIIGSVLRLGCVVAALYTIGGSVGASWGTVVAGLCSFGILEYMVRKHLGHHSPQEVLGYDGTLIYELQQQSHKYIHLIIITVMMGILTNSDVLIAQHIFGGEISGTYASVAVVAKFVVFIGLAAETVLLPKLLRNGQNQHETRQIGSIILLMIGFGIVSLMGGWLVGGTALHLLKPGLELHLMTLLGSLTISRCILTLSISSKTLVNSLGSVPLWIIGIMSIIWYSISTMQTQIEDYLYYSIIILGTTSIIMWGLRLWSSQYSLSSRPSGNH